MAIPHTTQRRTAGYPQQAMTDAARDQDDLGVHGLDEQFLSLMLADQQLVDAEFNALIAEQFAGPPAPPSGRVGVQPTGPSRRRVSRDIGAAPQVADLVPFRSTRFRQRSPPRARKDPGDVIRCHQPQDRTRDR
jgi:hypothetical protein